jgi:hypothetical protein
VIARVSSSASSINNFTAISRAKNKMHQVYPH